MSRVWRFLIFPYAKTFLSIFWLVCSRDKFLFIFATMGEKFPMKIIRNRIMLGSKKN